MRQTEHSIVSLDWRTDDAEIRNERYGSPASLLDFDVAIWRPHDLLLPYLTGATTYQGLSCLSDDASFRLTRDVNRRRKEMLRFLKLGKTLVIFVPEAISWNVATGEKQHSGTGRNRTTTRIVTTMSIEDTLPVDVKLVGARGEKMRLVAGEPYATFWRASVDLTYYSAYLEDALGTVIATVSDTSFPVACTTRVGSGRLLLLPDPTFEEPWTFRASDYEAEDVASARKEFKTRNSEEKLYLGALRELLRAMREESGEFSVPEWANTMFIYNESALTADLRRLEESVEAAVKKQDRKASELNALSQRKLLFTGSGPALETVAERAFAALGFSVNDGEPGREDRVLASGKRMAVAEIKGKSKSASEADAAQLEKWVSEYTLANGVVPKGILVVNAWRNEPLTERNKDAFPSQMQEFSKKRDHCLITGIQLLGAWHDAEANPKRKKSIVRSILDCVGVYPHYSDWTTFLEIAEAGEQKAT